MEHLWSRDSYGFDTIMKRCRGFSLLELLIVLGIFGMLLTVTLWRFDVLGKVQEQQEVESLYDALRIARRDALTGAKPVALQIQEGRANILVEGKVVDEIVLKQIHLSPGSPLSTVTFTKKGRTEGHSAGVLMMEGRRRYEFVVSPVTGRVRLVTKEKP